MAKNYGALLDGSTKPKKKFPLGGLSHHKSEDTDDSTNNFSRLNSGLFSGMNLKTAKKAKSTLCTEENMAAAATVGKAGVGFARENPELVKKAAPIVWARTKPTIIRTSKSSENMLQCDSEETSMDPFERLAKQVVSTEKPSWSFAWDELGDADSVSSADMGSGAIINPSFRLESAKAKPAPGPPPPSNGTSRVCRRAAPPPPAGKPRKKAPPPPRPMTQPGQMKNDFHRSANDLDLLQFDPILDPKPTPSKGGCGFAVDFSRELEEIFESRNTSGGMTVSQTSWPETTQSAWGSTGAFEDNATSDRSDGMAGAGVSLTEPHAVALYDYDSDAKGDVNFKAGDVLRLLGTVDSGDWLSGYHTVTWKEGIFPASFVEIRVPLPSTPVKPSRRVSEGCLTGDKKKKPSPLPQQSLNEPPALAKRPLSQEMSPTGPPPTPPQRLTAPPPPLPPKGGSRHERTAIALHDYTSRSPGDLTFAAGETIHVTGKAGGDWLKGRLGDREGIFPANFVRISETLAGVDEGDSETFWAVALFDYSSTESGDLSFKSGSLVQVLGRVNAEWSRGECLGLQGQFPSHFVRKIADAEVAETRSKLPQGEALYSFSAETAEDLSFQAGDTIYLVEEVNADWWRGVCAGSRGIFPKSFLRTRVPLS